MKSMGSNQRSGQDREEVVTNRLATAESQVVECRVEISTCSAHERTVDDSMKEISELKSQSQLEPGMSSKANGGVIDEQEQQIELLHNIDCTAISKSSALESKKLNVGFNTPTRPSREFTKHTASSLDRKSGLSCLSTGSKCSSKSALGASSKQNSSTPSGRVSPYPVRYRATTKK